MDKRAEKERRTNCTHSVYSVFTDFSLFKSLTSNRSRDTVADRSEWPKAITGVSVFAHGVYIDSIDALSLQSVSVNCLNCLNPFSNNVVNGVSSFHGLI